MVVWALAQVPYGMGDFQVEKLKPSPSDLVSAMVLEMVHMRWWQGDAFDNARWREVGLKIQN